MKEELSDIVPKIFHEVSKEFNLEHLCLGATESLLLSPHKFAIGINLSRDGPIFTYWDLEPRSGRGFDILRYLITKRRDRLRFDGCSEYSGYDRFARDNLVAFERHLRTGAQDILAGSKDWIREYPWPSVAVKPEILRAIHQQ